MLLYGIFAINGLIRGGAAVVGRPSACSSLPCPLLPPPAVLSQGGKEGPPQAVSRAAEDPKARPYIRPI